MVRAPMVLGQYREGPEPDRTRLLQRGELPTRPFHQYLYHPSHHQQHVAAALMPW